MSIKVESTAMRMDKIEEKMRFLSEEEAELYRAQLAEIKADFKGRVYVLEFEHNSEFTFHQLLITDSTCYCSYKALALLNSQ